MTSQRVTDIAVMALSASGGAAIGAALDAWWWIPVGFAGLLLAALLISRRSRQNEADEEITAVVMDAYGITEFRRVVREELASALQARGGGVMIEITVRLDPGQPMPGQPGVRQWQDGPVWHLAGEPDAVAELLVLLGRSGPHGHVIDGRTRPPSVKSSKDVPSGCAKYIDADGNEDGPYCAPDLKDWIRDKISGRAGGGQQQAAF